MARGTCKLAAMAALIFGAFTALALSSFAGAKEAGAESFEGTCELSGSRSTLCEAEPCEDPVEINERCSGSGLRLVHGDARVVSLGLSG